MIKNHSAIRCMVAVINVFPIGRLMLTVVQIVRIATVFA